MQNLKVFGPSDKLCRRMDVDKPSTVIQWYQTHWGPVNSGMLILFPTPSWRVFMCLVVFKRYFLIRFLGDFAFSNACADPHWDKSAHERLRS